MFSFSALPVSFPPRRLSWLPGALLVVALAYMPLFWLLTSHPVQPWDEARTGLNALNILRNHEWLVLRDANQLPDLWNCKPPLWPWVLAGSFRLLGPGELGLRLPAALAGLATVLVVYGAGRRWLGGTAGGVLAAGILLTSGGFVSYHVTRSGDFDAFLTLWTTLGALSWLRYLVEGQPRQAWLTGLYFFLAAFTKGVAGLLFGPGLLLATLALGQGKRLGRPAPWLAIAALLGGLAVWYGVRERAEPGYLAAVWLYELGGPATTQMEGHITDWYYYLANLMENKFAYWLVPALLGGLLGWRQPVGSPGRALSRLVVCVVGCFMAVLALTQNRLPWYDAPIYPLLALLAAAGLLGLGRAAWAMLAGHLGRAARLGALALVLGFPYWAQCRVLARTYDARYAVAALRLGPHLQHQTRALPQLTRYYVGTDSTFNDVPPFYIAATEMRAGHYITPVPPAQLGSTTAGQVVAVCGAAPRRRWERQYRTTVLLTTDSCVTLRLDARR